MDVKLWLPLVVATLQALLGLGDEMEYRLVRDLMRHYDQRIRPSKNSSEPLNVTFGLALAQIIDVEDYFLQADREAKCALDVRLAARIEESLSSAGLDIITKIFHCLGNARHCGPVAGEAGFDPASAYHQSLGQLWSSDVPGMQRSRYKK